MNGYLVIVKRTDGTFFHCAVNEKKDFMEIFRHGSFDSMKFIDMAELKAGGISSSGDYADGYIAALQASC